MSICGIFPPFEDSFLNLDRSFSGECILKEGHSGPHVLQAFFDRWTAWELYYGCDCREKGLLDGDEDCECYTSWPVSGNELAALLREKTE